MLHINVNGLVDSLKFKSTNWLEDYRVQTPDKETIEFYRKDSKKISLEEMIRLEKYIYTYCKNMGEKLPLRLYDVKADALIDPDNYIPKPVNVKAQE